MAWPLDQILFQKDFGLLNFEVLGDIGSDHFPVLARLCHASGDLQQTPPEPAPNDLEEARISLEEARALNPEGRR